MPVPKKLINYLERNKVNYEIIEHRTVYTAWDLSQTLHLKPQQIVKTLVVKVKGKVPALVILPADKKLDKKKLAHIFYNFVQRLKKEPFRGASLPAKKNKTQGKLIHSQSGSVPQEWSFPSPDLKGKSYQIVLAKEKWIQDKLLGKPGATPPFGRLLKLPLLMDRSLSRQREIILNSGDYDYSLKMKSKDFEKLEQPLKGNFGVKK